MEYGETENTIELRRRLHEALEKLRSSIERLPAGQTRERMAAELVEIRKVLVEWRQAGIALKLLSDGSPGTARSRTQFPRPPS